MPDEPVLERNDQTTYILVSLQTKSVQREVNGSLILGGSISVMFGQCEERGDGMGDDLDSNLRLDTTYQETDGDTA